VFCPRCGNNNDNNARFCFSCGQRFQQGTNPAGPSGPQWGQFQDPTPAPTPTPQPVAPPPQPTPRPVQTQVAPPPPVKRTNPALAVAIIAGLVIIIGAVAFVTRDDSKSSGPPFSGVEPDGLATQAAGAPTAGAPTPSATRAPSLTDGPVVAPGYKLTAIFVPPQGSNDTSKMEKRLYDAIVAGVDWNDSAKLYGRRYPLQYIFQNATTNLLLKPPNPDEAKKLLAAAGFQNTRPKFLLTFNPSDSVFASWLTQQISNLGFNVVTDPNSFTADEKSKGYHGMIIAVLPA
jgi:hypothetical protein